METMRFHEKFRGRDIGVYTLYYGFGGFPVCHMIIMDLNRPSSIEDYSYLKSCYEEGDEFGRSNFIKVVVISEKDFDKEHVGEIEIIASQFLEYKEDTDWNMDFVVIEKCHFDILGNKTELFKYAQECAKKLGLEVDILNIPEEKFNNFTQC